MGAFQAIDELIATARTPLPAPGERRRLRQQLHLDAGRVAQVCDVDISTLEAWEAGQEPAGAHRARYTHFLTGAAARLRLLDHETEPAYTQTVLPLPTDPHLQAAADEDLYTPQPCVLCGHPARQQVAGFPQHLTPEDCQAAPADGIPSPHSATPSPAHPPLSAAPPPPAAPSPVRAVSAPRHLDPQEYITAAVDEARTCHRDDPAAAWEALKRRAIPDAMRLLELSRKNGRYDIVYYPSLPDILRRPSADEPDQIWEARPHWRRPHLPLGEHQVTALDVNGAYLSALQTHLPLGRLEHSTGDRHDSKRAGVHLITPPDWPHDDVLPNPLGSRDEPGPLWVTEPTLRLLLRLSTRHGLCERPRIHESYTSGCTEHLLVKFRNLLRDARQQALEAGDDLTREYVKAMYAKLVSTMGESNANRDLCRPDWMHLIRSQSFANLWMKAHKAHQAGLGVVRVSGTDELHVTGDWCTVFTAGHGLSELKAKETYTVHGNA
ncbi:transcriptional regulator [Streptomyces gilvifuscus]|uniref:Transcriptional regulator n=1 Tax=Streptomyces gilvifuscus TaxID=1550617 RepID=A0ABT5G757_9ACTN|nr:transcriptional regulator [Streptomyces gilvifuscus]MDC2960432.1 transcriptional regulator [Streptomyces gilvifuscus]